MSLERLPREGEVVLDANGARIGVVQQVLYQPAKSVITNSGYHLHVRTEGQAWYLPVSAIHVVDETGVHLNVDQATIAERGWHARPDALEQPPESGSPAGERFPGQLPGAG